MLLGFLNKSKWFDRDIFKQGIKTEGTEGLVNLKNPMKLVKKRDANQIEEEEEEKKPVGLKKKNAADEGDEDFEDEEETNKKTKKKDKLKVKASMKASEKRQRKVKGHALYNPDQIEEEDNGKIEFVPELRYDDYDPDSLAEMRALATKMLRKKDREELIEDSYNRYSRPVDEDAPDWFLEDEKKHSFKILPITKGEYAEEKKKLMEIKNRPIKKV